MDGHNFFMQLCRHNVLLKYNRKPKLIILSLNASTLEKRKDLYNPQQFLPYMNEPLVKSAVETYQGYNWCDYYFPLIRYFGAKSAISGALKIMMNSDCNLDDRYKGYAGQLKDWTKDLENAKKSNKTYSVKFDSDTMKLFDKFLKDAKDAGIKIIFVYTPEYTEGQAFVENRKSVFLLFNHFATRYAIPFYDYSNDPISYEKKYFYNSQHLNSQGADLFTKKFIKDVFAKELSSHLLFLKGK
jgi:hypothetical protein